MKKTSVLFSITTYLFCTISAHPTKYSAFNYSKYNTYAEIASELYHLSKSSYRSVKLKKIGITFERRNLFCLEINKERYQNRKKKFIIECGAHAREWISPATCMNLINKFMNVSNEEANSVLDNFDIVVIPILNPDGYAFTWHNKTTRNWRKNRSVTKSQQHCVGVDVNRNFKEAWGGTGSSNSPCSNVYHGSHPLSEKEPQALVKYITKIKNNVIAYFCLHSYGETWSTPWGYTAKKPTDFDDLVKVGRLARDAIKKLYGTKYSIGNAHNYIYTSSGNIVDFLHARMNIKYTFFIEMRPKKAGFVVSQNIMLKNSEEMFEGIVAVANLLKKTL